MFSKVLIANRGEIALRIIRSCRELGISTVAVHSTVDINAMHVRLADEMVAIGPPRGPDNRESYLSDSAIISAGLITGADAIHPGYGFLSENADFAERVEEQGIKFIGPSPEHIRLMGDKIIARQTMLALGVPCVPGTEQSIDTLMEAEAAANEIGFPIIVKASAGGGGRGMKIAYKSDELVNAFLSAQQEAEASFGSREVYIEKFMDRGRHIEVQVLGDGKGGAIHLGERDCTIQRRHQKLLEESPSPVINDVVRDKIGQICCRSMAKLGYAGVGTIEFLYQDGEFYFIEMNTRLQVEHTVTEMIYGLDLVEEQMRVASGLPLSVSQDELEPKGHAIEVRINAESLPDFCPNPGRVDIYYAPGGYGVRMDSALYSGYTIPPNYDSLIAKLIVHGKNRTIAIARLQRALAELIVHPVKTTAPLFIKLVKDDAFISGEYDIHWLERWIAQQNMND